MIHAIIGEIPTTAVKGPKTEFRNQESGNFDLENVD